MTEARRTPDTKAKGKADDVVDPAPRSYPPMVSLLRRGRFDPRLPASQTSAMVADWLLGDASAETDLLELFQSFIWRIVAAGLPVDRASLHAGTLHPQLFGYAWNWNIDDGFCDEVKVDESVLATDAYRRNPLFGVIEQGEKFRARLRREAPESSPLLQQLAAQGITDYAALPLSAGGAYHNAATLATRQAGGFSDEQFAEIEHLLRLLALHVERHIALLIARNLVTTYLGDEAGDLVLGGRIKRGSGTAIDSIIWVSDLRGFTNLADRLGDRELTAVLNVCFEGMAGAVLDHGGEILKFIGDGLLAVFPIERFDGEGAAAEAAIDAAGAALHAIARLNADESILAEVAGWRPLRVGIALHRGEAFFGNVGAPRRLDFTVIGKAVNAASRVEGLCKSTGRSVLVTEPVAVLAKRDLDRLGAFELRGLNAPLTLYALREG